MRTNTLVASVFLISIAVSQVLSAGENAPSGPKPPAEPAKIVVSTPAEPFAAGSDAVITIKLEPSAGVKINRYPQVRMRIAEQAGVTEAVNGFLGDELPPPLDKVNDNYFDPMPPVVMTVKLDPALTSGVHELDGKTTYFYCVPASGFCAPVKAGFKIPIKIR